MKTMSTDSQDGNLKSQKPFLNILTYAFELFGVASSTTKALFGNRECQLWNCNSTCNTGTAGGKSFLHNPPSSIVIICSQVVSIFMQAVTQMVGHS